MVEGAAGHAGVGGFGVTNRASFVNFLGGEADVRGGRDESILARNTFWSASGDFTPFLISVIFVGEAALGEAFNLQRICLRAITGGDHFIMGRLGLGDATVLVHRLDLTKEQRDGHIRRYAELLEARADVQSRQTVAIESKRDDGRGHRPQGVASQVAAETGLSVRTVQRALNPPPPRPAPPIAHEPVEDDRGRRRLIAAWGPALELIGEG